jgi:hypothetical protein
MGDSKRSDKPEHYSLLIKSRRAACGCARPAEKSHLIIQRMSFDLNHRTRTFPRYFLILARAHSSSEAEPQMNEPREAPYWREKGSIAAGQSAVDA